MSLIDKSVIEFMTEQNKRERAQTVHVRFLDEAGRCVVLETGERMPYTTHPVHHHFYFGQFTEEQARVIASTFNLKPRIYAGG